MNVAKIAINEIFQSIQGEGVLAGNHTIFIRTQGCHVGCKWCDTKDSWAPYDKMSPNKKLAKGVVIWKSVDLYRYICDKVDKNTWVCFTGGEPLEQFKPMAWIIEKIHSVGYKKITIETSGIPALDMKDAIDLFDFGVFFSLSPKLPSALNKRFNYSEFEKNVMFWEKAITTTYRLQFKYVISTLEDIVVLDKLYDNFTTTHHLFAQIDANKLDDNDLIKEVFKLVERKKKFRLTIQQHKVLKIR